jgi:hypothetical protein
MEKNVLFKMIEGRIIEQFFVNMTLTWRIFLCTSIKYVILIRIENEIGGKLKF